MVLDRNSSPYYDDYNEDKKFVQILFRPGYAVQARELSQIQSMIQNQIDRFGKHIFKEGSMVIPGQIIFDNEAAFVKLEDQYNSVDIDVDNFADKRIFGVSSGAVAVVIDSAEVDGDDPNTLYLKYETGESSVSFTGSITSGSATITTVSVDAADKLKVGALVSGTGIPANTRIESITSSTEIVLSNNATATNGSASLTQTTAEVFEDGETIITEDGTYSAIVTSDSNGDNTGIGSRVQIERGVYFSKGFFLLVDQQSLILEKYTTTPSYKVGLTYSDSFVAATDDVSLNDPAAGSFNFSAPGADRYKIDLVLSKYALDADLDDSFIELLRVKNGSIRSLVSSPDYSELEKTLARRTYDESGNYTVRYFPLQIKEHLNDGTNLGVYTSSNGGDETKLIAAIEPGKAYVLGYEIESASTKMLEMNKARETETENNAVVPFALGNYVNVDNLKGIFDITSYEEVELLDAAKDDTNYPGNVLGTAKIRAIEFVSGTPGDAAARYKFFLFDVEMDVDSNSDSYAFSDVRALATSGQAKDCDIVLNTDSEAQLYDTSNNRALLEIEETAVKTLKDSLSASDTTYTVKRYETGTMTGNSLTLTAGSGEIYNSYSVTNYQVAITSASGTATGNGFATGDIINLADAGNSVTLSGSPTGKQVVITIPDIADSGIAVITTITKSEVTEKTKTLTTNTETLSHSAIVQLEKADIYAITSIVDLSDSNTPDITSRYTLDNGQRDNFYDRGRLIFNSSSVVPAGNIQIQYQYFNHGAGDFFSVDSYDGVIDYEDIQTYKSPTTGKSYNLRNTIDFRPRVNDTDTGFSVTSEIVAPAENFRADYDYYLARVDKIVLDYKGAFSVVEGVAAKSPVSPNAPENTITLYEIDIPPYTFQTSDTSINKIDNKRYTMRDIGKIEKRVENLEYYSSLNLLEKETANLFVDDGTGANRFKSGFLVDNFTSHYVGDVSLSEYQCAIDKENGVLRPSFYSDSVSVTLSTGDSSNYQKTGDLITLPYTTEVLISQPNASTTENINPFDVFNWAGSIVLTPETDEWYETSQAPDMIITNDDGLADSLAALNGQTIWNDWETNWIGTTLTSTRVSSTRIGTERSGREVRNVFAATNLVSFEEGQVRTGVQLNVQNTTTTQSLGERVVNTSVIPWIREKDVNFECKSLKPNTRVYPFFDDVDVSAYVKPTGGSLGDPLVTNVSGEIAGTFEIPNTDSLKFRTGERLFRLVDSSTNDANFTTTSGDALYTAKGILQTVQETILSTRSAKLVTTSVTDSRTIIGTDLQNSIARGGWYDPLAQTFLIENEGGVFLSKIDIYFATKAEGVPVTLQIRNVVNGYPGQYILPFSEVILNPSSVNTSSDGQTATSFTFESPVYLQDGGEYCFVLLANTTEYTIWTSTLGETDIFTGERISEQPYAGVMFKSQNASTWTASQEQDIKFDIHRCVFNTNVTGSVLFKNDDVVASALGSNPFYTTTSSTTVLVIFPNHGLQDGEDCTITGVAEDVNGIPLAEFNDTHTITYVDMDSFEITVSTTASDTGLGGGTGITATGNSRVDVVNPVFETVVLSDTSLGWGLKLRNSSNVLHTSYIPFDVKSNVEFTDERFIFSPDNEAASKSLHVKADFTSDNDAISPVIDTQRASAIAISNRINNDSTDETLAGSGDALARYITKKMTLTTPANSARVYFAAVRPPSATIKVYIKYLTDSSASGVFDDQTYTELTQITYPNGSEIELKDYVFEIDGLESFSVYAIKIVMMSEETSDVPLIKDFRTIAFGT